MPEERPRSRDQHRTWASGRAYNCLTSKRRRTGGLQNAALSWKSASRCESGLSRCEADFFAEGILSTLAPFIDQQARLAVRSSAGRIEAEDARQIARLAVMRALAGWKPEKASFWTWAYQCVRSDLRGELRKAWVRQDVQSGLAIPEGAAAPPRDLDALIDICRALEGLPERLRHVAELHLIEGYSLAECARAIGVSRQRVDQLFDAARAQLDQTLGDAFIESSDAHIESSDAPDRDAPPDSPA